MRHPEHDRLTETIRGWYIQSAPEMGYHVEERRSGWYMRNVRAPDTGGYVTVRHLRPMEVPALLADLRNYYGSGPVHIYIDNRDLNSVLGRVLVTAGCALGSAVVYLAHVGPVPEAPPVPGMTLEAVTPANLGEWTVTREKGFADSEEEPDPDTVQAGVALRRAEMNGAGRFLLARVDGEPAGIIGFYEGEDRFIFQLATRLPFRNRGIARWLLCHVLAEGYAEGCRSVVINTDPADTPIQIYRRLGFTDEVYWRQHYRYG